MELFNMQDNYILDPDTSREMNLVLAQILDDYKLPKVSSFSKAASGVSDNFASALSAIKL